MHHQGVGVVSNSTLVKKINSSPFDHNKDSLNKRDINIDNMKAYSGMDNRTNPNNKDKS
jgi:hypothetical protein